MIGRRQLAVASPISVRALARAFVASSRRDENRIARARALVRERFEASSVVLTDSGTSALVLALRLAVPRGGVVAFPAFACVDLVSAAQVAGVRVRLYDIDPATLSPDLDSLDRTLARGVDAIVVAHLYGYAADVPGVQSRAAARGVPVIEDAAQGAGGMLGAHRLGTFGDLRVLSFGRGKGLCAGGGGALLASPGQWASRVDAVALGDAPSGAGGLLKTAAQWVLGRPGLYAIPSMLPWLRLGEMVYHPGHEPESISRGSCELLASALSIEERDLNARRARADALQRAAAGCPAISPVTELAGARSGFLRFPVRDLSRSRRPDASMGVLRSYPGTLAEQPQLLPILVAGEPPMPGATELGRSLFTLPTHRFVSSGDVEALSDWLATTRAAPSGEAPRVSNPPMSRV